MNWNYRIVRKDTKDKDENLIDASYFIVEAFYDENGKVSMITQEPQGPIGDNLEELMTNWVMIAEAFKSPILNYDKIPEEGAINELAERLNELKDSYGNIRDTDELIDEGKLIKHEDVFDGLLKDFDLKEYQNEQEVMRQKSEKMHQNRIGKSLNEVIGESIELFIKKDVEDS